MVGVVLQSLGDVRGYKGGRFGGGFEVGEGVLVSIREFWRKMIDGWERDGRECSKT